MMYASYPEDWFYHPNSRLWWNSRYRRWFTQAGDPIEILRAAVDGPTGDEVKDRIHLNWQLGVAMQRHGERECQTAMEELIMESLETVVLNWDQGQDWSHG